MDAAVGHRLTVDQTRHSFERERGAGNQREAPSSVMPVASEKPHARTIAAHQHSAPAGGFGAGLGRQGSQKSGEGYSTQQHRRKK
jgi:hypothetical protein